MEDEPSEIPRVQNQEPIPGDSVQETTAKEKGRPAAKRRCVSTACIPCRRRKSKCDGSLPSCAACSSVYHTSCVYDPNSDHRRKGVYRKDTHPLRTRNTTLQTLIEAIVNYDEADAFELLRRIRSSDSLEDVAESVIASDKGITTDDAAPTSDDDATPADQFESELVGKTSELMLGGSRKFIGGTSNLIFLPPGSELYEFNSANDTGISSQGQEYSVARWTRVTDDERLINHLMTMYFTWHYPFFTLLSKDLFYRDYVRGVSSQYCSSLLVNVMLSMGCHFSSWEGTREARDNSATAGDHFFKEAKKLILENDEHVVAKLCTVQALALMSLREAGCGREGKGWGYSGMSFRMISDLGLNVDTSSLGSHSLGEEEMDACRVTFWGCFVIDKCWSKYLGRQPQLSSSNANMPKMDTLPREEAELWTPYTDSGVGHEHTQPSRTRAVALQVSKLSEISGDLLVFFYHPTPTEQRSKQGELKKLSEIHTRLEAWKSDLPKELDPKEGQLPQVLVMHMFYQVLLIHLYRPFLKYTKSSTPLPQHVSPRKLCTQAASAISKLLRLYKRSYGFNQAVNFVVYIAHTACTIHLLNMPEKNAQRDVIHGLRHLEEMGENWLCARRTLRILDISANKWQVQLPNEAGDIFERTHTKWGSWGSWDQATSSPSSSESPTAGSVQPSAATPSKVSPPLTGLSNRAFDLSARGPTDVVGMMPPQYRPGPTTIPTSMPTVAADQGPANARVHQSVTPLPEPTYLRPATPMFYPIQPVPLSQNDRWYNNEESQLRTLNVKNESSADTDASSMAGFDPAENLVEESQDWWSRIPSTLNLGTENWGGWQHSTPGTADARYEGSMATSSVNNDSRMSQPLSFPTSVPPPHTRPSGDNGMLFPSDFPR